jgi:hypothetical protein
VPTLKHPVTAHHIASSERHATYKLAFSISIQSLVDA